MSYIKGFNRDLKCRGMQYEVGKEYRVKGELELCYNGIHFCDSWVNVIQYYNDTDSRYCEVEPIGEVLKDNDKYCARGIKIIRELTAQEIVDNFIPDVNAKNNAGWSPLYAACCNDNADIAKWLIDKGADVNAKDNAGWSPLYAACCYGYMEIANYLRQHGAKE